MKLSQSFKINLWQIGVLKLTMFCIGTIFGIVYAAELAEWMWLFLSLFVAGGLYITYLYLKQ